MAVYVKNIFWLLVEKAKMFFYDLKYMQNNMFKAYVIYFNLSNSHISKHKWHTHT